jgi:diguanylate cyclase (GGDEF)-like protein
VIAESVPLLSGSLREPPDQHGAFLAETDAERCETSALNSAENPPIGTDMDGSALRDELTGLPNRHRFQEELGSHVARARRSGWSGAVIAVDLDDFNTVVRTMGDAAGDQLVRRAAEKLQARLRGSDLIARVGGAEFAVLLHDADVTAARIVADTLVTAVASEDSDERPSTTASVGIALVDGPMTGEELTIRADAALNAAKARGGSNYMLYAPTLDRRNGSGGLATVSAPPD